MSQKIRLMSSEERWLLAKSNMATVEELVELSNTPDWLVKQAVAGNRNTSPDILDKLSNDEYIGVVFEVARNPRTPVKTLAKLFENSDYALPLAQNPACPIKFLKELGNDKRDYVRKAVDKNLNKQKEIQVKENLLIYRK